MTNVPESIGWERGRATSHCHMYRIEAGPVAIRVRMPTMVSLDRGVMVSDWSD